MLAPEIIKKVKQIQLKTAKLSTAVVSGHYASVFKGVGMEFAEVREYIPGDDIRTIDWNVTARTGSPYVKRYTEERELTVMLVVDLSGSLRFGTKGSQKADLAAEISALLAFLAIKNNDKVGLLIFSDHCELFLPPQKGRRHVLRVIREILGHQPAGIKTNISAALSFLGKVLKHKGIVFLISDFLDDTFLKPLKNTAKRHDIIAIGIEDEREWQIPPLGLIEFEDCETGETLLLDTSQPQFQKNFSPCSKHQKAALTKEFQSNQIDYIRLQTGSSYLEPLQKFFLERESRLR